MPTDPNERIESRQVPASIGKPQGPRVAGNAKGTVAVDDSEAVACYANFCRVTATAEEVILDLAVSTQLATGANQALHASQRVILSHYTLKRLAAALAMTVQRHEQAFGVLETDVNKRIHLARRGS